MIPVHAWCIYQAIGLGTALGVVVWMIWLSKQLIIELDGIMGAG